MHCEKKQTMQRCNIWQFIYKKKELQSDVKRCKGRRQNGNISAKWQNWLKAHLSSWGISSPRGFTHRKSRTSSKFGTCKSQTWLSSTNRSIDWEKRFQETFQLSLFPLCGNIILVLPTFIMCQSYRNQFLCAKVCPLFYHLTVFITVFPLFFFHQEM